MSTAHELAKAFTFAAFGVSCLAADAGEPPFFIKAGEAMCPDTGALIEPLQSTAKYKECYSVLKPMGVVVLDVEPQHTQFTWVCRIASAGAEKAVIDYRFACGYALTRAIVRKDGSPASLFSLRQAARAASMEDVRRMGPPPFGCMLDDKAKWC